MNLVNLTYPFAETPGYGEAVEVAPGVYWSRLPLPFKPNHINVWLLEGDEGLAVVDTGMRGAEAEQLLAGLVDVLGDGAGLSRVMVTHMHPDHVGQAGQLVARWGAQFWMTRLEYLTCRALSPQSLSQDMPLAIARFFSQAGWSPGGIEKYQAHYGSRIVSLPDSYRRLEDGQIHRIGGYEWRVIVGRGHSPEHACFYCKDRKLLISGDQVLPRISSNVSVSAMEPTANPMADWINSLQMLKANVPEDVLVLPAHGECFRGLHTRIDTLLEEQERSFDALHELLAVPKKVVDVFPALFNRTLSEDITHVYSLATGEAVACLNYLLALGRISQSVDEEGISWYQAK
ncbi:MBL fold metallo-hydrolase [Marinobacterium maritimum]|uniref:MBL fold metallo-hydrolase n=2 Tax=Marinobacterium maritimum TaxID=500162 RepID=A0ABN1I4K9_9GAMM